MISYLSGQTVRILLQHQPVGTDKILDEDRIQILLQNAKQILNIVTATFSPSLFDERRSASGCSDSSIERLGCVWVAIMQNLNGADLSSHETSDKLLLALSKVP